ncbi:MAG: 4-oxalocrotonate decarboxylase [Actinomycetia bacterium]|nr:4-oxalocrotonate decarboxylase [Actinomycetes bacterium]MCP4087659.1 4-oxalocrotonate decarboxylase [Actinomycetes bacterium]
MPMTDAQRREAAAALVEAELTRNWIEPITLAYEGADISDAYAIGQYVTDAKVAAGRVVKGHKVGLTSKAMRSTTGATEPDYGTLFDNWFLDEGTQVSMSTMNRPMVEIELVFVLKDELSGPSVNAIDVIRATDFIVPAVEVVDGRYSKRGKPGVVDSIADAATCGFIMVGGNPRQLNQLDIRHVAGALYKNGEIEESGTAAAVMGNPVNSVAWLARKLDEFGVRMEAGHTVLSGSFIRAHPMRAGDSFVADFGPLGQISFGIVD